MVPAGGVPDPSDVPVLSAEVCGFGVSWSVLPANQHTTRFVYDQLGRRSQRRLPLGQTESYAYDANGNLSSRTDFNGHTTTYTYDNMNRLLSKTADPFFSQDACANGACGATQVSYTYTPTGKRASMTDASGMTTYSYDFRVNRPQVKSTPIADVNYGWDGEHHVDSKDLVCRFGFGSSGSAAISVGLRANEFS